MQKEDIKNMPAGKKMNQLIWWKIFDMDPMPLNNDMDYLPDYSGELSVAWSVVEKIHKMIFEQKLAPEEGFNYLTLTCMGYTTGYAASFDCLLDDEWYENDKIVDFPYAARGADPALAICRAAMLVVLGLSSI